MQNIQRSFFIQKFQGLLQHISTNTTHNILSRCHIIPNLCKFFSTFLIVVLMSQSFVALIHADKRLAKEPVKVQDSMTLAVQDNSNFFYFLCTAIFTQTRTRQSLLL